MLRKVPVIAGRENGSRCPAPTCSSSRSARRPACARADEELAGAAAPRRRERRRRAPPHRRARSARSRSPTSAGRGRRGRAAVAGDRRARPARDRLLHHDRGAALAAAAARSASTRPRPTNRPGRHGVWQRPLERRRLAQAALLVPQAPGALAEAGAPATPSVVVPIPVEPSGPAGGERDIAAITYAANPHKKGLDRILAAWAGARRDGRGARRLRHRPRARGRPACATPASSRPRPTGRCCGARGCTSPPRGARTTASRSSRRWPTAACS